MNQYGSLTIVMPFRPGSKNAPYIVSVIASSVNGLDQDRYIDVGQIRSIDNSRILDERRSIRRRMLGINSCRIKCST